MIISSDARRIAFNGRFLVRRQSGVQRVACQLLQAIDRLPAAGETEHNLYELICPQVGELANLDLRSIGTRRGGYGSGSQLWEQLELPMLARGQTLVNLCNTAPLLSKGGITMMHDAQVYLSPDSYSAAFVAWYRSTAPIIASRAAQILTVSEFSKRMLVKFGVAEAEKVTVVHNGVDHMLEVAPSNRCLERLGLQNRPFVLAMANSQSHKNLSVLFRAFALPQLARIPLVLFGHDGPDAFPGAAIPSHTIFTGRLPDEEIRGLMEAAQCFAFPSTTEGFGLPPLEAMSVGCPAIVAPCGALPEVCGDAVIYAEPDDANGWAQSILTLIENQDLRERLSAQGVARAQSFTWDRAASQVINVINKPGLVS